MAESFLVVFSSHGRAVGLAGQFSVHWVLCCFLVFNCALSLNTTCVAFGSFKLLFQKFLLEFRLHISVYSYELQFFFLQVFPVTRHLFDLCLHIPVSHLISWDLWDQILSLSISSQMLKMDLHFLLEPFKSRTTSSIQKNWYNFIKMLHLRYSGANLNLPMPKIILQIFSWCSWASGRPLLLFFSSFSVPVTLFPPSTHSTTACLPNLRQRHQALIQRPLQKAGWFVVGCGVLFLNGLPFWSWSKYIPFKLIKTCPCFLELVTFWTPFIKYNELFWGWPRKLMDLFLWLMKAVSLLLALDVISTRAKLLYLLAVKAFSNILIVGFMRLIYLY